MGGSPWPLWLAFTLGSYFQAAGPKHEAQSPHLLATVVGTTVVGATNNLFFHTQALQGEAPRELQRLKSGSQETDADVPSQAACTRFADDCVGI